MKKKDFHIRQKITTLGELVVFAIALSFLCFAYAQSFIYSSNESDQNNTINAQGFSEKNNISSSPDNELNNLSGTSTTNNSIQKKTSDAKYVESIKTDVIIPYQDEYRLGSNTSFGYVETIGGKDGHNISYTLDSYGESPGDISYPASNRIIYVGDGGANLAIKNGQRMHTNETYGQLYNRLLPGCDELLNIAKNSTSALQWCKENIILPNMALFGF
jgi:hypothetical protein